MPAAYAPAVRRPVFGDLGPPTFRHGPQPSGPERRPAPLAARQQPQHKLLAGLPVSGGQRRDPGDREPAPYFGPRPGTRRRMVLLLGFSAGSGHVSGDHHGDLTFGLTQGRGEGIPPGSPPTGGRARLKRSAAGYLLGPGPAVLRSRSQAQGPPSASRPFSPLASFTRCPPAGSFPGAAHLPGPPCRLARLAPWPACCWPYVEGI